MLPPHINEDNKSSARFSQNAELQISFRGYRLIKALLATYPLKKTKKPINEPESRQQRLNDFSGGKKPVNVKQGSHFIFDLKDRSHTFHCTGL